ncbi:MAG: hypothetical protein IPH41_16320 [Sulfuritalea sp.]|jgi:opacity protein-like surface antigen|nr:hypothetical protein [Sulfuritalea sp.]MBP9229290.1 hypothetical protein [Azonexus sp.]
MNKQIAIAAVLACGAGSALAADYTPTPGTQVEACLAAAAASHTIGGATTGTPYTTADSFIKTSFGITCSANTSVFFTNAPGGDATRFTVGSGSVKGNQTFKGSSAGGAVTVHAAIPANTDAAGVKTLVQTAEAAANSM